MYSLMNGWAPAVAATLALTLALPASASTLDKVRERGHLTCGVNEGLAGFAEQDAASNTWSGFDVDYCRAVAAAALGDASKVKFVPLNAEQRFDVLRAGGVDVLIRNTTWTIGRELEYGLTFAGVSYYDGQGFMVPRDSGHFTALDLDGSAVCVIKGSTSALNLPDFFGVNNMALETVAVDNTSAAVTSYEAGLCNVVTSDISQLFALRLDLATSDEHFVLPDAISKEPLGPVVRQDDQAWAMLVKWVHFALLNAEELGVRSDTVEAAMSSDKPAVRRFVGNEGMFGEQMGVEPTWAIDMVAAVGNYGEIFERNLGTDSPLGIPRGMNQLWNRGGVQYAPPLR